MNVKTRHYEPALITLFRIIDAIMAALILYVTAYAFSYSEKNIIEAAIIIFLLTIIVYTYTGVYRSWRLTSTIDEIKTIVWGSVIVFVLFNMFVSFFNHLRFSSRNFLLLWLTSWLFVLCTERVLVRTFLRYYRSKGRNIKRAVIVGTGAMGEKLARWINENPWSGTIIEGFFNGTSKIEIEEYPVLGTYEEVAEYVRKHNIESVYIALPVNHTHKMKWLLHELGDSTASVYMVPDVMLTDYIRNANVRYLDTIPVLSLVDSPFCGCNAVLKRIEDIVLASLIMIFISPLLIFISILIKITTGGPVLFKQWRYGLNGKRFLVWKFRTMTVSEDGYKFNQATYDDTRITNIGKILRKYYLDEFPQFINVIFGDMSIVGPRPHAISMVEDYRKKLCGSIIRQKIKPGITGLAQLYGAHGEIDTIDKTKTRIQYDIEYIRKWSLLLDLRIIMKTPIFIFKSNKAVV